MPPFRAAFRLLQPLPNPRDIERKTAEILKDLKPLLSLAHARRYLVLLGQVTQDRSDGADSIDRQSPARPRPGRNAK